MDSPFLTDRMAITIGTVFYAAGLLYGCLSLLLRRRHSRLGGYVLMALGWLVQTAGLALRGHATRSCPIGNTFEVLQFVAWSCTLLYLFVGPVFRATLLGLFTAGLAVFLGTLSLVVLAWDGPIRVRPLGADPVIAFHASLALFSYGVLALLALTSLMYLIQHRNLRRKRLDSRFAILPSVVELDHINLRLLAVGLVLLTAAVAIAGHHWYGHPGVIAPAKLVAILAVWFAYVVLLVQRLRQRWVAQRFALLGLILFLAPLLTLWLVHSPHRTPVPTVAPASPVQPSP